MTIERWIIVLLVLLILAILISSYINKQKREKNKKRGSSGTVSKAKYMDISNELDRYRSKFIQYRDKCDKLQRDYKKIDAQNEDLLRQIGKIEKEKEDLALLNRELTRKYDELNKLLESQPVPVAHAQTNVAPLNPDIKESESKNVDLEAQKPENPSNEEVQANPVAPIEEVSEKALPKEVTMYASFPRSAGNCIYFSDLTEIIGDDSYFELKISKDKNTATFRPLDFMKIRNYDAAMIAILTDGVKPNAASSVIGIENGKVHKEGSDWIIDTPAKIKLA